jgi:hypothetical protein
MLNKAALESIRSEGKMSDLALLALHASSNKVASGSSGTLSTSDNASLRSEFFAGFDGGFGRLPGRARYGAKAKHNRSRDKYYSNRFH